MEFLGHMVDQSGIRPLPANVEAITKYTRPTMGSQMLSFMGMINFCMRFYSGGGQHPQATN